MLSKCPAQEPAAQGQPLIPAPVSASLIFWMQELSVKNWLILFSSLYRIYTIKSHYELQV